MRPESYHKGKRMPTHPICRWSAFLLLLALLFEARVPDALSATQVAAASNGLPAALVLGQLGFGSTRYTSASSMYRASGVAVDPSSGAVFVADSGNNRVLRFAAQASLTDGALPEAVLGQLDFTNSTAAPPTYGLKYPDALELDASGRLWVADTGNNRVLRFDNAASKPSGAPPDAVLGQPDFTRTTPATTAHHMRNPQALAVDASGRLWVGDSDNYRVLRFDNAASKPNGAPADGVLGQPDFTTGTDWLIFTDKGVYPNSLEADADGRLWVSNNVYIHSETAPPLMRFDNAAGKPNGAPADGALFGGFWGTTLTTSSVVAATPRFPSGMVMDGNGRLWVSTTTGVVWFDRAASKPDSAPPDGILGAPDLSSAYSNDDFRSMHSSSIALGEDGRLWFADYIKDRVLRFDNAAAKPSGAFADGVLGRAGLTDITPAPAPTAMQGQPLDVTVDPTSGKVFVVDTTHRRVLRFASLASLRSGADAEGVLGQPDFGSVGREGNSPNTGLYYPSAAVVDASGRLWVAEGGYHRVLRFDNAASKPNGAPADGVLGQPDFNGTSAATTAAGMNHPGGLAADSEGRLWVYDANNNRVLRFDNAAAKPNGAPADGVLGQPDFSSSAAATSAQGMRSEGSMWGYHAGLAVDADGRLWAADAGNNRVLRFDNAAAKPNGAPADRVLGQRDFTSATVTATAQSMWKPSGVAVDTSGRVWVADRLNNRVLGFEAAAAKPNGAAADVVLGQTSFNAFRPTTNRQGLRGPSSIAVDSSGKLWVADTGNNRVLLFDPDAPPQPVVQPSSLSASSSAATLPPCSADPCPPIDFRWTLTPPLQVEATVTITLPAGLELVGEVSGGTSNGKTVRFSSSVQPGHSYTISYQARPRAVRDQLLTTSASVEAPGVPPAVRNLTVLALPPESADALVMIYASGDNDLRDAMLRMASNAERATADRVVTLLLLDGPGIDDAFLYKLLPPAPGQPDCFMRMRDPSCGGRYRFGQSFQKWPDNVASADVLTDFLAAAQRAYPAQRRVLSLVGHGGGWSPNVLGGQPSRHGGQSLAGMLWDDQPKASVSTVDLARALNEGQRLAGAPLDLLFLDACSMGQIEVAYELRDSARFLLASPNWKWAAFPYDQHLADATVGDGRAIGEAWLANEEEALTDYPYTYTLLDLRRVEALRTAVNGLAGALMSQPPEAVKAAFRQAERYDDDQSGALDTNDSAIDLGSFTGRLLAGAPGLHSLPDTTELTTAAAQLQQALGGAVVKRSARSGEPWPFPGQRWSWEGSSGLAIYLPLREQDDWRRRHYRTLAFGQGSAWASLIDHVWSGAQPPSDPDCTTACAPPPSALPLVGQRPPVYEFLLPLVRR